MTSQSTFNLVSANSNETILHRLESELVTLNNTIDTMFQDLLNSGVANANSSVKLIIKQYIDDIKIKLLNDTINNYKDIVVKLETYGSELMCFNCTTTGNVKRKRSL
jgi:hypothetical protein